MVSLLFALYKPSGLARAPTLAYVLLCFSELHFPNKLLMLKDSSVSILKFLLAIRSRTHLW